MHVTCVRVRTMKKLRKQNTNTHFTHLHAHTHTHTKCRPGSFARTTTTTRHPFLPRHLILTMPHVSQSIENQFNEGQPFFLTKSHEKPAHQLLYLFPPCCLTCLKLLFSSLKHTRCAFIAGVLLYLHDASLRLEQTKTFLTTASYSASHFFRRHLLSLDTVYLK